MGLNPTVGYLNPAVFREGDVILIVVIPAGFELTGFAWFLKSGGGVAWVGERVLAEGTKVKTDVLCCGLDFASSFACDKFGLLFDTTTLCGCEKALEKTFTFLFISAVDRFGLFDATTLCGFEIALEKTFPFLFISVVD